MGYSLWCLKGSDTTEVTEHAHCPIPWVSTPSGQPPLSQLRRPLPRPPLMSQVSPLTGVGTRSPSGVCAVSCQGRLHWFPTRGLIWTFLWGPCRVQVLQEQVSPGMNGRWSGHQAPCFRVQLSCDMMLAHRGLQEGKGPHVLESLWTHCECQLHQCPCSPRAATSRCSHKLLPWGLSTECVHLLRLFLEMIKEHAVSRRLL